jgi:N-acetylneuraminic acid mutarotase
MFNTSNVNAETFTLENTWQTLEPIPTARAGLGVAVVDGKIYAIGGDTLSISSAKVNEMYDPENNAWIEKKPMPTGRTSFGIAVWDNKIYCIGGQTSDQVSAANEVYDPATDSWKKLAPMPMPRFSLSANAINGKIYLISGNNDTYDTVNFNHVYDIVTDSWTTKDPIPVPVCAYASTVIDEKIYIINGVGTQPTGDFGPIYALQIYNPDTDSWNSGAVPPSTSRVFISAVATSGTYATKNIYVFGQTFNFIYNPESDIWSNGTRMPNGRDMLGLAVVNDLIFAIGGTGSNIPVLPQIPSFNTNERYIPFGYSETPLETCPSSTGASEDNQPTLPNTIIVVGVTVAISIIAVTVITVYHFKHAPAKAVKTQQYRRN